VSVRAGRASLLPYAVIRLAPDLLEVAEQRFLQSPGIRERTEVSLATCMQHIDELAEDVELALRHRAVADTYRDAVLVAGQPRYFEFRQPSLPGDAVHDLQLLGMAGRRPQQPLPPRFGLF